MKKLLLAAAAILVLSGPAFAIDPSPEVISNTYKSGKTLHVDEVAALMRQAAKWCYKEDAGTCEWSEIYLSVADGPGGVVYEATNSWNDEINVSFVDKAQFTDDKLCEFGFDKVPSTRAVRTDGTVMVGRELDTLRQEITAQRVDDTNDCFDYVYVAYDAAAQTMQLKQRQYVDGVVDPALEAPITLYFDETAAAALTSAF